jgi:CopG antitoxin of type II toxin-antitoxin system
MADDNVSSISEARSTAEMADFWDTHDATEFDDKTHQVTMEFDLRARQHYIAIDPDLVVRLREAAQARGLSLESLANLWLQERVLAGRN